MGCGDRPVPRGRGAGSNPANRFESSHHELDLEHVQDDADYLAALGRPATEFLPDRSRSLICRNDSPDVGFEVSLNPYRGCEHGCIYCYARPLNFWYLHLYICLPKPYDTIAGQGRRDKHPCTRISDRE